MNYQKMSDPIKVIDEQIAYHEAVIKHLQERREQTVELWGCLK